MKICGEKGKIEGNKFIVSGSRVVAYGSKMFSTGICEWKIKYNFNDTQCCREIGITASENILHNNYIHNSDEHSIVWFDSNFYANKSIATQLHVENIDKNGDIVTITLDMNQNKVSFYKNDQKDKLLTTNIEKNKKYRLCGQ